VKSVSMYVHARRDQSIPDLKLYLTTRVYNGCSTKICRIVPTGNYATNVSHSNQLFCNRPQQKRSSIHNVYNDVTLTGRCESDANVSCRSICHVPEVIKLLHAMIRTSSHHQINEPLSRSTTKNVCLQRVTFVPSISS
jgi:hypothetical protein